MQKIVNPFSCPHTACLTSSLSLSYLFPQPSYISPQPSYISPHMSLTCPCGNSSVGDSVTTSIRDAVCPVFGMFGKTDAFFVVRAHQSLCQNQLSTSQPTLSTSPFRSLPLLHHAVHVPQSADP